MERQLCFRCNKFLEISQIADLLNERTSKASQRFSEKLDLCCKDSNEQQKIQLLNKHIIWKYLN